LKSDASSKNFVENECRKKLLVVTWALLALAAIVWISGLAGDGGTEESRMTNARQAAAQLVAESERAQSDRLHLARKSTTKNGDSSAYGSGDVDRSKLYMTLSGRRCFQDGAQAIECRNISKSFAGEALGRRRGHSVQEKSESSDYLRVAYEAQPAVVCEIRFNAGHSAAAFLIGSDRAVYQGFDMWAHSCNEGTLELLTELFGERILGVEQGDSTETVPRFVAGNPSFRCDLTRVDGRHYGEVPLTDLRNVQKLAHANTLVIMDDIHRKVVFEGSGCKEPMRAWDLAQTEGWLSELECHAYASVRGMCVGRFSNQS
jgi:hypothetical protein